MYCEKPSIHFIPRRVLGKWLWFWARCCLTTWASGDKDLLYHFRKNVLTNIVTLSGAVFLIICHSQEERPLLQSCLDDRCFSHGSSELTTFLDVPFQLKLGLRKPFSKWTLTGPAVPSVTHWGPSTCLSLVQFVCTGAADGKLLNFHLCWHFTRGVQASQSWKGLYS